MQTFENIVYSCRPFGLGGKEGPELYQFEIYQGNGYYEVVFWSFASFERVGIKADLISAWKVAEYLTAVRETNIKKIKKMFGIDIPQRITSKVIPESIVVHLAVNDPNLLEKIIRASVESLPQAEFYCKVLNLSQF